MGLFDWLMDKAAGALGLPPGQRVRTYRVTLFGEALGTFTLPVGDHMANPSAPVRAVLTRPFRVEFGADTFFYWAEPRPGGGYKVVEFHPNTPARRKEAVRFFNTAHGLDADGSPGRRPLPPRTPDEDRLICAVLARRDADEPYLEYAGWLAARGDTYGDFIRLTVELGQIPEGDDRRPKREARRDELVAEHGPRWVLPLADVGVYPGVFVGGYDGYFPTVFHGPKGVIEELDVDRNALAFPANAARLFAAAPFLRKLTVAHDSLTLSDFAAVPQFAQLESLSLSVSGGTAEDIGTFAGSPHLGALRELGLSVCSIGPDGAGHLMRAPWLAGLRALDLGSNGLGDAGAAALAAAPAVANLTALDLRSNDLTDPGLIALSRSPHLGRLSELNLEGNAFTAEGVRALAAAPFARALTSLKLSGTGLDGEAMAALAAGAFPALTELDLSYCAAGDEGVRAVVAAPFFRTLEAFRANATGAGEATAGALAALGPLPLRELELANNALSDAAVGALAGSKAATKLTKLTLNDNPFGKAGTTALAGAELGRLEHLDLCQVACGYDGGMALAAAPHFKRLKKFWISESRVGAGPRQALVERFTDDVMTFTT
jgi:uncharacterized protein (TIGR02996 family)